MTVRRVVTEVVDGRSRVLVDGPAALGWCDEIWVTHAAAPAGEDPGTFGDGPAAAALEPPVGGARFRMVSVPPDAVMRERLAASGGAAASRTGVDDDGYHATDTIDYVYVLDGDVVLELDDGEVRLHPGDCVVQRASNHAWRNPNDEPIRLLVVMVSLA